MIRSLIFILALGIMAVGCAPQTDVEPKGDSPSLAAQGPGDTIHVDPDTVCGATTIGNLVDALGRTGSGNFFGADTYGTYELIATPQEMVIQYTLARGWFVASVSAWMGDGANIPRDNLGNVDAENLPVNTSVRPVRNIYEVRWPLTDAMRCPNSVWIFSVATLVELDFLGNPFNDTPVFLEGTVTDNSGSQWVGFCAEPCGSGRPPCAVPTPGPGDDLSEYECQRSGKVTVCHVPPGNPANMHEICISVNALPAHILEFKPANNPCMGHHSGCHIGPCDPCGPGSTGSFIANYVDPCPGNGGNGGGNGRNR